MNEKEYKAQLTSLGISEEQAAKVDFDAVEKIVQESKNIDDLCNRILGVNPDADVKAIKEFISQEMQGSNKASEAAEDLSDEALEEVAGGSAGSWFKKNKDWLVPLAVGITAAGLSVGAYKLSQKIGVSNARKAGEQQARDDYWEKH